MDIARLNLSHATHEDHRATIATLRRVAARAGTRVPIIADLSGPRAVWEGGHSFDAGQASITEKDLRDLAFAADVGVDSIAASYVGTAEDIADIRAEMAKRDISVPVIAKIERREAVDAAEAIIAAADAVMIARGDLGSAVPLEDIPFIERDICSRAHAAGTSVIVATQMLYSMVERSMPTRAEVTDIAFAILSGADAVMLSDETARGAFPVEAVAVMSKVISRAETSLPSRVIHPLPI